MFYAACLSLCTLVKNIRTVRCIPAGLTNDTCIDLLLLCDDQEDKKRAAERERRHAEKAKLEAEAKERRKKDLEARLGPRVLTKEGKRWAFERALLTLSMQYHHKYNHTPSKNTFTLPPGFSSLSPSKLADGWPFAASLRITKYALLCINACLLLLQVLCSMIIIRLPSPSVSLLVLALCRASASPMSNLWKYCMKV